MFDCHCAGLIHPFQNTPEQNPVFFSDFDSRGIKVSIGKSESCLVQHVL